MQPLPAKAKPSPLLWLRRLAYRLNSGGSAGGGRSRCLAGVANVVPGHVQEDGLDGDQGLFGREFHNVVEVHAAGGVLVQTLDQRRGRRRALLLLLLAQVVHVDDGLVAAQLAADEVVQGLDSVARNLNVWCREGRAGLGARELLGGVLAAIKSMLDKSEGVGDIADGGMRAGNGEGPIKVLI